jgi:hypothetical protein
MKSFNSPVTLEKPMPFIVIETTDPSRTVVIPLDGGEAVEVSELCRGQTLAEIMNAIEDAEIARCRAKHAAVSSAWEMDDRIALGAATPPVALPTDDDDDGPDPDEATVLEVVVTPTGGAS